MPASKRKETTNSSSRKSPSNRAAKPKKRSTASSPVSASKSSNKKRKLQKNKRTKSPSSSTKPSSLGNGSEKVQYASFCRLYEQEPVLEVEEKVIRDALQLMWDQKLLEVSMTLGQRPNKITLTFQRCPGESPPWVDMSIAIDEQTTQAAIKHHWPTIKRYREALCKVQGPWNLSDRVKWCQFLIEQKAAIEGFGYGYGSLAKFLNRTIEILLNAQEQAIKGEEGDHHFGERSVLNMMMALGFDEEDAKVHCKEALDDIRSGRTPTAEPFLTQEVRKQLDWYLKHYPLGISE